MRTVARVRTGGLTGTSEELLWQRNRLSVSHSYTASKILLSHVYGQAEFHTNLKGLTGHNIENIFQRPL